MIRRWILRTLTKLLNSFVTGSPEARAFANACGLVVQGVGDYMEHPDVAVAFNNLGVLTSFLPLTDCHF